MEDAKKVQLSKGILEMKFMKKTKERVEQELDDEEGQAMYSNEITEQMRKGGKYAFVEVGIGSCKDFIEGRLSFGGMNPLVEKMMADETSKLHEKVEKVKETEFSDIEMAKHLAGAAATISKKFQTKNARRQNQNVPTKRKFIKPQDD